MAFSFQGPQSVHLPRFGPGILIGLEVVQLETTCLLFHRNVENLSDKQAPGDKLFFSFLQDVSNTLQCLYSGQEFSDASPEEVDLGMDLVEVQSIVLVRAEEESRTTRLFYFLVGMLEIGSTCVRFTSTKNCSRFLRFYFRLIISGLFDSTLG